MHWCMDSVLYVVTQGLFLKTLAGLVKGCVMAVFGLFVLWQAATKVAHPVVPHYETIFLIGLVALIANIICFVLLSRHRGDDLNMRSVWVCSRNDIIANVAVLLAAVGVGVYRNTVA